MWSKRKTWTNKVFFLDFFFLRLFYWNSNQISKATITVFLSLDKDKIYFCWIFFWGGGSFVWDLWNQHIIIHENVSGKTCSNHRMAEVGSCSSQVSSWWRGGASRLLHQIRWHRHPFPIYCIEFHPITYSRHVNLQSPSRGLFSNTGWHGVTCVYI